MIRVQEQKEPATFAGKVKQPGLQFLASHPDDTPIDWDQHDYWRRAAKELYDAYDGICAYTCHKIWTITGSATVDHFIPKSVKPRLAYDWGNMRLACGRMNARKGKYRDVLDPFRLKNGVFAINFPSLQVQPSEGLSDAVADCAWRTIERLKLNDETCIKGRHEYVRPYCEGVYGLDYLAGVAPFIHREIVRQNLAVPKLCEVMTTAATTE